MASIHWVAATVFVALFVFVTVLGFVAARWRRGDLNRLDEWGLAGRRFGTIVTWFLLGGDLRILPPHGRILPLGAAIEMIHNATLVHDDLQDGDEVRRGHPAVWKNTL